MNKNKVVENIINDITYLGSAINYFFITIIFYFINADAVAFDLLLGIILSLIIVVILRLGLFKPRPKKEKYEGIIEKIAAGSFPSHHSANIGLLTVILSLFFNNTFFTLFLLLVSAAVLYSRVYLKKHYWIDVIVGHIIGMVSGYIVHVGF